MFVVTLIPYFALPLLNSLTRVCGQSSFICGDPRFVSHCIVSHVNAEGARNALSLAGTMLGYYPVRVLPSKTAIAPVNPTFLPRVRNLVTIYLLAMHVLAPPFVPRMLN